MVQRFDAAQAECLIFTFKEGFLSAIAHDLKIRVTELGVEVDGESRVTATFDASSLQVVCARRDGVDDPRALSDADKRTIQETIASDVLDARKFPQIRFASTSIAREGDKWRVRGDLTLHGVTRPVEIEVRDEDGARVGELALHQPDFGIKPYRAMLGTLKLRPDVRVRVRVPAPT